MAKGKRRKVKQDERLWRVVTITTVNATFRLTVEDPKEPEPQIAGKPWLELRGTMDEPVRDIRDVVFSLYPDERTWVGTARPASVGSIIQLKPHVRVVAHCAPTEFDRLWQFALSGHCKHAHMIFTKPHYNTALVTNLSFSSEPEE